MFKHGEHLRREMAAARSKNWETSRLHPADDNMTIIVIVGPKNSFIIIPKV